MIYSWASLVRVAGSRTAKTQLRAMESGGARRSDSPVLILINNCADFLLKEIFWSRFAFVRVHILNCPEREWRPYVWLPHVPTSSLPTGCFLAFSLFIVVITSIKCCIIFSKAHMHVDYVSVNAVFFPPPKSQFVLLQ